MQTLTNPTPISAGQNCVRAFLILLLLLVVWLAGASLSGCGVTFCGVFERRCIETTKQAAIRDLVVAERNVVEACHISLVKLKQPCAWPPVWPATVSVSEKKGEPSFIQLPSVTEFFMP